MTTIVVGRRRARARGAIVRQLGPVVRLLACCYGAVLAGLLAIIAVRMRWGIPTEHFLRDMANLTGAPPYFGLFSSVGIVLWAAAATLCVFTAAAIAARASRSQTPISFWVYAGVLSLALLADDLFLLHEVLFPFHLHVPEPIVYVLYGLLAAGFLAIFHRTILRTEYLLLALALGWFAASLVVDRWGHLVLERGFWLVEDGFKMLGIVSWLAYFARTAYREVRALAAAS